jgi:hypothetical protein
MMTMEVILMINMVVCIDLKERVLDIGLKIWI